MGAIGTVCCERQVIKSFSPSLQDAHSTVPHRCAHASYPPSGWHEPHGNVCTQAPNTPQLVGFLMAAPTSARLGCAARRARACGVLSPPSAASRPPRGLTLPPTRSSATCGECSVASASALIKVTVAASAAAPAVLAMRWRPKRRPKFFFASGGRGVTRYIRCCRQHLPTPRVGRRVGTVGVTP